MHVTISTHNLREARRVAGALEVVFGGRGRRRLTPPDQGFADIERALRPHFEEALRNYDPESNHAPDPVDVLAEAFIALRGAHAPWQVVLELGEPEAMP